MTDLRKLKQDYSWIQTPLVVGAPMRLIALADMAVEISKAGNTHPSPPSQRPQTTCILHHNSYYNHYFPRSSNDLIIPTGGIGFIGAGTDVSDLRSHLDNAVTLLKSTPLKAANGTLPIGIGFINWGANLPPAIALIREYKPAAVWMFAPSSISSLSDWCQKTRHASAQTKIWVQVGSLQEARNVVEAVEPDVLVVQGTDAGGHGLAHGASLISLLPEVNEMLQTSFEEEKKRPVLIAAGGISNSRNALAALVLGSSGVCMGTRFLATPEANISAGYQTSVLRATDGGQTTVRTKVYDNLRGTTGWAESHNARGIVNQSYFDHLKGMGDEENKELYQREVEKGDEGWEEGGRMTAYAGSGVGLVKSVMGAGEVVKEIREGVRRLAGGVGALL
jgi:nitronate monooxygenase